MEVNCDRIDPRENVDIMFVKSLVGDDSGQAETATPYETHSRSFSYEACSSLGSKMS
jgi:hypothetical protein